MLGIHSCFLTLGTENEGLRHCFKTSMCFLWQSKLHCHKEVGSSPLALSRKGGSVGAEFCYPISLSILLEFVIGFFAALSVSVLSRHIN